MAKPKRRTKKAEETAITQIIKACEKLGWVVAFDAGDIESAVQYLIIGKDTEVSRLTNLIDQAERPTN